MPAVGSSARTAPRRQTLCVAGDRAFRPSVGRALQREKNRFFKSGLRLKVALGMVWTRHELAPAMSSKKIVNCAVAGLVADRLLVSSFKIVDVQHLADPGSFGELRQ